MSVELLEIPSGNGLDSIRVYWHDVEPGKGYATITCYGEAWACCFGAMGERTIQTFFHECDAAYLVNALYYKQFLKRSKGHEVYLTHIVKAVKLALANTERKAA